MSAPPPSGFFQHAQALPLANQQAMAASQMEIFVVTARIVEALRDIRCHENKLRWETGITRELVCFCHHPPLLINIHCVLRVGAVADYTRDWILHHGLRNRNGGMHLFSFCGAAAQGTQDDSFACYLVRFFNQYMARGRRCRGHSLCAKRYFRF